MPGLGELERAVMDVLWAAASPCTAKDVQDALAARGLATTTVLTVLGRLERKGLVAREREGRAHHYAPVSTREDHIAELMNDALGTAPDRTAALARFLGGIDESERVAARRLLDR
ncbi:MAG TPA: BlaI/MecI/CopY family transcriptional regulator [Mycobacteriales bacterium]|nr:BlaI/MecI/CopY family transcriptional regulator [Mycobacteriales bacterium]